LAFLGREERIPGLCHGGAEHIEGADIDVLFGNAAELVVKLSGVSARKLSHAANPENLEIAEHGWPDRDEILEASFLVRHKNPP
jgi:hypothetical protein